MRLTLIAAVARNGVIGRDGAIPWHLPADQARFKAETTGHVLVMGRRTYESIGRPLPGRTTVVVTRQPDWEPPGGLPARVHRAGSVPEALAVAGALDDQVFVVGGAAVYAEAVPRADRLLITWVEVEPPGDTAFPDIDWTRWREAGREDLGGATVVEYLPT